MIRKRAPENEKNFKKGVDKTSDIWYDYQVVSDEGELLNGRYTNLENDT